MRRSSGLRSLTVAVFLLAAWLPICARQGAKSSRPLPLVDAMAFRPQSESYNEPFRRRRVPEAEELTPGVGIRFNGDDDDGDSIPDRDDSFVPGENDLIEIELRVRRSNVPMDYVLVRSHPSLRVWNSQTKESAILDGNDEVLLHLTGTRLRAWVECSSAVPAELHFQARSASHGDVLDEDTLRFFAFSSIVVALDGEFQTPTDPPAAINGGIAEMAIELYKAGYDVHMYDEDVVAGDGLGAAYDEIVQAIQRRGVTTVAIYGFSHGAGSIYDLSNLLDANRASIGTFQIEFTAYIDGIENDSSADLDSEVRLPPSTAYHVNYYQRNFFSGGIWGNEVPGADVNVNVTSQPWGGGILHFNITLSSEVQAGILGPLQARVTP